jgi:hypothetical protein
MSLKFSDFKYFVLAIGFLLALFIILFLYIDIMV